MTHLLIIGQKGQLARALKEEAQRRGLPAIALGRDQIDLADPTSLASKLEQQTPSALINAAAYTAVDQAETETEAAHKINAVSPGILAAFAYARAIPFFHISTDYVFDGLKTSAYSEDDPTNPIGVYGRSKLAGEQAVLKANPASFIFRTAWVYSHEGHNFLKTMLRLGETRSDLNIVADQWGNPSYAPDLAHALLDCLAALKTQEQASNFNKKSGIYHLCGAETTNWYGFAEAIFREAQAYGYRSPTLHAIATKDYPTPAKRPHNSQLNSSKLKDHFGLELAGYSSRVKQALAKILQKPL